MYKEATEQIKNESTNIFQVPGEVIDGSSASKINEVISDTPEIQDSDSALAQNIPAEQRAKTKKGSYDFFSSIKSRRLLKMQWVEGQVEM